MFITTNVDVPSPLSVLPLLIRSRLEAMFTWSWCTAISCLIIGQGFPPLRETFLAILAMIFISFSVYLYNDVIDIEMDRLNPEKKKRPLAANLISKKDMMVIIFISGLIGLLITLSLNIYSFIFSLLFAFIYTIYSYPSIRLKTRILGKETTIFLGFPLCSLVGSYAILGTISYQALFATLLFGTFAVLGMPALVDFSDIEEDRLYGVKNLSVLLSWSRKMQLFILGVLFIMTVTPLTYVRLGFNVITPIIVVAMSLVLLRFVYPIMNKFDFDKVAKTKRIVYAYFLILQISMIIGSLNLNSFFNTFF